MTAEELDCSIDAETRAQMHKALDKWLDYCAANPVIRAEDGLHTFKLAAGLVLYERQLECINEASVVANDEAPQFRKVSGPGAWWKITLEQRYRRSLADEADEALRG